LSVIDGYSNKVTNIKVGANPSDIAVNPNTNKVYVTNEKDNTTSIIDGYTNKVTTVNVGANPKGIAINFKTNRIYIANYYSNTISIIDGETNKVSSSSVKTGANLTDIAINPNTNKVYVADQEHDKVYVIDEKANSTIENVTVGERPTKIAINSNTNNVYVVDSDDFSDTISVIDGQTNKVTNVKVGRIPTDISINPNTNLVYITTSINDTVTIIDDLAVQYSRNNGVLTTLHLGRNQDVVEPSAIEADPNTNTIYAQYVNNIGINGILIIDGYTNSIIKDIEIGEDSRVLGFDFIDPIAINPITNKLYVINSQAVSIIDGLINDIITSITFNTSPTGAGHIVCGRGEQEVSTNNYFSIKFGTECKAKPNSGFSFSSWVENLGHNSTRTLRIAKTQTSLDSILSFFGFGGNYESSLNATQYGNFTANFEKVPPPIPSEYWIPLYGIIVSSIVGWSIPSIIGWIKAKRQIARLNNYHNEIISTHTDKLETIDIGHLNELNERISSAYAKGKITEQHYGNLKKEVSSLYEDIYNKKLTLSNSTIHTTNSSNLNDIKEEISNAYAKGKITEQHYNLLMEKASDLRNTQNSAYAHRFLGMTNVSSGSPIRENK